MKREIRSDTARGRAVADGMVLSRERRDPSPEWMHLLPADSVLRVEAGERAGEQLSSSWEQEER